MASLFLSLLKILVSFIVDVTVYYDGHHGDLNETLFVGTVSESRKHLVKTAYECMMKGIEMGKLPTEGIKMIMCQHFS